MRAHGLLHHGVEPYLRANARLIVGEVGDFERAEPRQFDAPGANASNQFITSSLASSVGWRQQNGDTPAEPEAVEEPSDDKTTGGWLSRAMVINAVLLGLAGIAAVVLLVVALSQGS
jgi:hypothetical protein